MTGANGAIFSDDGLHRYMLWRRVAESGPVVSLIGVNPSRAGVENHDATIRRDLGFAETLGWGKIIKINKFAYCSTDVQLLPLAADPVGPLNDIYIHDAMVMSDIIVACWGTLTKLPPQLRNRWEGVIKISRLLKKPVYCFGVCKDLHPRHTLMLPSSSKLEKWDDF